MAFRRLKNIKKWSTIPKIKIDFAYTSEELADKEKKNEIKENSHLQMINNRKFPIFVVAFVFNQP